MNGHHRQVTCIEKDDVSDCKKYGSYEYRDPYNYFVSVITGCIECKGDRYTTGSDCIEHDFATLDDCKTLNKYKNECIECKSGFTLRTNGECETEIEDCIVA